MTDRLRAFVAIDLPGPVKAYLAQAIAELRQACEVPVRWANPQGIHLTLKFLGNVERDRLAALEAALRESVADIRSHRLALGSLGAFPSASRPRVLWVGLTGDLELLAALQQAVESAAARQGFPPEERSFTPHLTLGRMGKASAAQQRDAGRALDLVSPPPDLALPVTAITLMRSELRPTGAIYTPLAHMDLA
jgi:2'-5' RNA ligase